MISTPSFESMLLSEFDFPFDPSLIAERPVEPRDQARLMVVNRRNDTRSHARVADLPGLLQAGDVVVVNDTKVRPAALIGSKRPGGGKVKILLVKAFGEGLWEVFIQGRVRPGQDIDLGGVAVAQVVTRSRDLTTLRITSPLPISDLLEQIGAMPLPPYIKRPSTPADRLWYQPIFARVEGAVAAPTASLHFTPDLVKALQASGVKMASLTLHVGPGTFRPVRTEEVHEHRMDPEAMEVPPETVELVREAKQKGNRVVAIGTTVVRALEASADRDHVLTTAKGDTQLFITPGYRFQVVDAMMTNFHLPRSTLLMLVSAFAGVPRMREAYHDAVKTGYRFYSYGDAMLLL